MEASFESAGACPKILEHKRTIFWRRHKLTITDAVRDTRKMQHYKVDWSHLCVPLTLNILKGKSFSDDLGTLVGPRPERPHIPLVD